MLLTTGAGIAAALIVGLVATPLRMRRGASCAGLVSDFEMS